MTNKPPFNDYSLITEACEILDSRRKPVTKAKRIPGPYPYYGATGVQDWVNSYIFDEPLILIAEDCGKFGFREQVAYKVDDKCWVNNHAHVLRPLEGFDIDFLVLALNNFDYSSLINGTTRNKLNLASLKKVVLPRISIQEQKVISSKFHYIQTLIRKCELVRDKLDQLVKSRFIEMFGDPRTNSKRLRTKKFVQVVRLQRGFDLPVNARIDDGNVPVYGANGILGQHNQAKVFKPGIITGRSGTIGKVDLSMKPYWPLNTSLFSVDTYDNNIVYLKYLVEYFNLARFIQGAGVPTLNRNIVHDQEIIDVPLAEQQEFADFVTQVDKSQFVVQQQIDKLQTLYDSLAQEYFG